MGSPGHDLRVSQREPKRLPPAGRRAVLCLHWALTGRCGARRGGAAQGFVL